jgi:hypothetical protein
MIGTVTKYVTRGVAEMLGASEEDAKVIGMVAGGVAAVVSCDWSHVADVVTTVVDELDLDDLF